MQKILVFIYPEMADFEMILACTSIEQADNYKVVSVVDSNSPIIAQSGHTYIPQLQFQDIKNMDDIGGLIIPGGNGMIASANLLQLIQQLHEKKKMLAAICIAPEYLATSGILKGKKYTSSMQPEYYIENNRNDPFEWENQTNTRVWVEDHMITAKGEAFVEFSLKIWEYLGIMNQEEIQQEQEEFTPEWC